MEFSKTEQELYDFIVKNNSVSIKTIQEQLGEKYLGAIGKLIQQKKIIRIKRKEAKDNYATKMVTYYEIKKEEENNEEKNKETQD